ncbi:unnamed protein product [Schistosoma turkestanicum]|nr:unnamed protein product [Schistosoma turkestanicum]
MTDWYNTFLTMTLLKLTPNNIHILIADGHPAGSLDNVWYKLFGNSMSRIGAYRRKDTTTSSQDHSISSSSSSSSSSSNKNNANLIRTLPVDEQGLLHIANLVMIPYGYASPIYVDKPLITNMFIEEFRQFFLQSYQLNPCDNNNNNNNNNIASPQIIIISRRDYIAHPRNMNGHISRKIQNEPQLLNALKQLGFQNSMIIDLANLTTMSEQLQLMHTTDILIGMHGAALTYSLLLPASSCLIELFPNYCCQQNQHFVKLTKLRQLCYQSYYGSVGNDLNNYDLSQIPVDQFKTLVLQTYQIWKEQIVSGKKSRRNSCLKTR